MKRTVQLAALAAALVCAGVVVSVAARGQGHGPTPINPAVTYEKNCATCHGKDGSARTFKSRHHEHARDLTDPKWQTDVTDERIYNTIANGKGKMPAFKRKLTDEQITSLVAYVRGLKR
ncbi:MAG TPA: cytochrome c [Pyrinomonadaceae bacterium]|nr:cytochrome c [Pyrinomonadaceae bacterium]